jgi:hypothetical protein
MARCRGNRPRWCAHAASSGGGGSDRAWYSGMHLLRTVPPGGRISGCTLGPAGTAARCTHRVPGRCHAALAGPADGPRPDLGGPASQRADRPLTWPAVGPSGPLGPASGAGTRHGRPILAARGLTGVGWIQHWHTEYGAVGLTHAAVARQPAAAWDAAARWCTGWRQVVATANTWLVERFGLQRPRARSYWGLRTRVGPRWPPPISASCSIICLGGPPSPSVIPSMHECTSNVRGYPASPCQPGGNRRMAMAEDPFRRGDVQALSQCCQDFAHAVCGRFEPIEPRVAAGAERRAACLTGYPLGEGLDPLTLAVHPIADEGVDRAPVMR